MKDAAAAAAAAAVAPAVGGLGSYKGVMLCSRPPDDSSALHGSNGGGSGGTNQAPFRSTIAATVGEQLGLPPPKRLEPKLEVKTRGPSAALRRHCQWIKELQQQVKDDQRQVEEAAHAEEDRKDRMQQAFKQQRDAIRRIKNEKGRTSVDPADVEAILRPGGNKAHSSTANRKPLWAMTEDEKECFENDEAAQLISFVEDLDFDRYIDDLEFREHLQIVRDRAKRLQREQNAFKDSLVREFNPTADDARGEEDEAASTCYDGSAGPTTTHDHGPHDQRAYQRCANSADHRPDWDGSTTCGDDRQSLDRGALSAAERALEANPQLRAIHSKGSLQRLVGKAQERQDSDFSHAAA